MRIITWNINGYRAITGQNSSKRLDTVTKENKLFSFIEEYSPNIIGLQEIKASDGQISEELLAPLGYYHNFNYATSKKGYSGVAVFSKEKPLEVNSSINIPKFDTEGRILECNFNNLTAFTVYFPKGYTDNERLDYKLEFYDSLFNYITKKYSSSDNIIVSGDYNTAHKEIDLARPKDNTNTSGFLEVERVKLDEIIQLGFSDAFRLVSDEKDVYSWWSHRSGARGKNIGWRIDYHFISSSLKSKIKDCFYAPNVMGSDHCPVVIDLDL